jgi:RNA polymerase sigma factor (TIGR02999 family)
MDGSSRQISELLSAWNSGDESSLDRLVPMVETELRRIARNYLRHENANCSMHVSDLINEAYLKLVGQHSVRWSNSSHFFAVASLIMRRILINHARDRIAGKRGGGATFVVDIDVVEVISTERTEELISLDHALTALTKFDEVKGRIVQMRYFGGLSIEETANVMKIKPGAVCRHWNFAKVWLAREMRR